LVERLRRQLGGVAQPRPRRLRQPRRRLLDDVELLLERRQRLADAVVEVAREAPPLRLLDVPHRARQAAEAALAGEQLLEEPLVLPRDLAHAAGELLHALVFLIRERRADG